MHNDSVIIWPFRYSMFETKRVFWQFEVEGAPDTAKVLKQIVNDSVAEFLEHSERIHASVKGVSTFKVAQVYIHVTSLKPQVRQNIAKTRHQQWWLGSVSKKHESRLDALRGEACHVRIRL
jgi:hypothetical protein